MYLFPNSQFPNMSYNGIVKQDQEGTLFACIIDQSLGVPRPSSYFSLVLYSLDPPVTVWQNMAASRWSFTAARSSPTVLWCVSFLGADGCSPAPRHVHPAFWSHNMPGLDRVMTRFNSCEAQRSTASIASQPVWQYGSLNHFDSSTFQVTWVQQVGLDCNWLNGFSMSAAYFATSGHLWLCNGLALCKHCMTYLIWIIIIIYINKGRLIQFGSSSIFLRSVLFQWTLSPIHQGSDRPSEQEPSSYESWDWKRSMSNAIQCPMSVPHPQ